MYACKTQPKLPIEDAPPPSLGLGGARTPPKPARPTPGSETDQPPRFFVVGRQTFETFETFETLTPFHLCNLSRCPFQKLGVGTTVLCIVPQSCSWVLQTAPAGMDETRFESWDKPAGQLVLDLSIHGMCNTFTLVHGP